MYSCGPPAGDSRRCPGPSTGKRLFDILGGFRLIGKMKPLSEACRKWLKEWSDADREKCPTLAFSGLSEFLLAHGRMFERGILPSGARRGAKKTCFQSAFVNVREDSERYLYCEGRCWSEESNLSFSHAWFIDRLSPESALDTTLLKRDKFHYIGIPISFPYIQALVSARRHYGSVFDSLQKYPNPIFTGEDSPEEFLAQVTRGS
jgi:hypothetical protein